MNRNYAYRLYPTRPQSRLLSYMLEAHRRVYNDALHERNEAWRMGQHHVNFYDQVYQVKPIRSFDEEMKWLNFTSVQRTLRRLDKTFSNFFRYRKTNAEGGHPRFKSKPRFNSVEFCWGNGMRFKGNRLHIHRIGEIKIKWHRDLPEGAVIKTAYLKRKVGKWFVILSLEIPDIVLPVHAGPAIGIDMGLESFAVLSDGMTLENPRWYRHAEERLSCAQRVLSGRVKGSHRYRKQSRLVAKQHEKITNQRLDYQHKLSHDLANAFGFIAIENLNIEGMVQNHSLAKSIGDAAWGQFSSLLAYKVESTGGRLVEVNPYNTSQTCSGCGEYVRKELSERVHRCPACGLTLSRDHNAARNILHIGLELARAEPSAISTPRSLRL